MTEENYIELKSVSDSDLAITKNNDKYILTGKNKEIFGTFDHKLIAKIIREVLARNKWDLNFIKTNNIIKFNNYYHAFKIIDNQIVWLGPSRTLSRANDLINIISSNIKFIDGKYQLYDGSKVYGVFDSEKIAELAKEFLNKYDWNIDSIKQPDFILYKDKYYGFSKSNGTLYFIKEFDYYKDSIKRMKKNAKKIELNSENDYEAYMAALSKAIPVYNYEDLKKQNQNIQNKNASKRVVENNQNKIIGHYSNEKIATIVRVILNENDWDLNYFKRNDIIYIDNEFLTFTLENNIVNFLGSYFSYDEAKKAKNQEKTLKKSVKDLNIKVLYDKYVIVNENNEYGYFDEKVPALIAKKILKEKNWNMEYFKNGVIALYDEKFYIFNIKNDKINLLGQTQSYIRAFEKIDKTAAKIIIDDFSTEHSTSISRYHEKCIIYKDSEVKGIFNQKPVAILVRDILDSYEWDLKDNLIVESNDEYFVFEGDGKKIELIERYSILEKAKEIAKPNTKVITRDLDSENLNTFKEKTADGLLINPNIKLNKGKYVIFDEETVYGSYETKKIAKIVKKILENNNWNIKYFTEYNIFKDEDYYYVFKLINRRVTFKGQCNTEYSAKKLSKKKKISEELLTINETNN